MAVRRDGNRKMADRKNGKKKLTEDKRLSVALDKANTRITEHTEWMRDLSHDLRRLSEKLYGLTEGTVTVADARLPLGRYRTPDQTPLDSSDLSHAAERMVQVKRRFLNLERDLASADDLRARMEKIAARRERRRKASRSTV